MSLLELSEVERALAREALLVRAALSRDPAAPGRRAFLVAADFFQDGDAGAIAPDTRGETYAFFAWLALGRLGRAGRDEAVALSSRFRAWMQCHRIGPYGPDEEGPHAPVG